MRLIRLNQLKRLIEAARTDRDKGRKDMIQAHIKKTSLLAVLALLVSASIQAQGGPPRRGGNSAIETAAEAFGLSEEQVDEIRKIRQERPNRDLTTEELQAWRNDRQAKIQGVLTDEQKAQVSELNSARETMRAFPGAMMLGLVDVPNRGRQAFQSYRNRRGPDASRGRQGRGFSQGRRGRSDNRSRGRNRGWKRGPQGPGRDRARGRR